MAKPNFDARRFVRILVGERPVTLLGFVSPTLLAVAIDGVLRPRSLLAFEPLQWLNYFGSSLASAGFWGGPMWLISRLFTRPATLGVKAGLAAFFGLFVFPLSIFCFGGQPLYFQVFHAYMARDTVRLGIAMRGTLGAWLAAWGGSVVLMGVAGLVATAVFYRLVRFAAKPVLPAVPIVPVIGFGVAAACFWMDFVESRSLQAAPPDTCFIHGAVHALREAVTHKGWVRRGISLREPLPLPPLPQPAHRPNVLLIVTESVRADAFCSIAPPQCKGRFLDEVAADRIPMGRLTTQAPGTISSCVMLWTGLGPDADFKTMLSAPVLWEVARAVGYRTAYITSQNLRYEDFAAFFQRAGIDVVASAAELGGAGDPHLGAPDENATARMLDYVRGVQGDPGTPYFATLHLSNTHWPYRVDPALQPFSPHDPSPWSDGVKLHNHYRNSVAMQERTVSALLRDLRALPSWDDTVVVFVSDHGEEFREHGGMYHLTSLFDEQVRIPGWVLAGRHALEASQREALAAWADRRTFTRDVNATLLDVLGVFDARGSFPYADRLLGRSLVRPPPPGPEPMVPLSTASGVWEPDLAKYGMLAGDRLVVRSAGGRWDCYDAKADPTEHARAKDLACVPLIKAATETFAGAP